MHAATITFAFYSNERPSQSQIAELTLWADDAIGENLASGLWEMPEIVDIVRGDVAYQGKVPTGE